MKKVYSWLRTWSHGTPDNPRVSSEEKYSANLSSIDCAIPTSGGKLRADGTWLQESWVTDTQFSQSLKNTAHANDQLYIPSAYSAGTFILDDLTLQETAADNLVNLAISGRFDSPWDGVMLNLEGIPSSYKSKLSAFLRLLSYKLRSAGLVVGIATRGKASDPGPDYDECYSYDLSVVAQVADIVYLGPGFWAPVSGWMQRSLEPYWWRRECIEYALSRGIPAHRMLLGHAVFSQYYPQSTSGEERTAMGYNTAMDLVNDAQARVEWIERDSNGLVRENLVDLGPGHIWLPDGDVLRHRLALIDEYGLLGLSQFIVGLGDDYHWQVIEDWKDE